ncbi:MAG: hypothetical protein J0M08_01465 [Bacteroidetes bacterium]|nr:hypothetical protein [Bacteroidota bacterium]
MRKGEDDLFQLIKSLTIPERKQFYSFANKYDGDESSEKTYMLLFEAIDKSKNYNESDLKKKFADTIKNFAFTKKYLFQLIIKTLKSLPLENDIDAELEDMIHTTKILRNKKLYHKCLKNLYKCKELAYAHEKYSFLERILALEISLHIHSIGIYRSNHIELTEEFQDVFNKNNFQREKSFIHQKLIALYSSDGLKNEKKKEIDSLISRCVVLEAELTIPISVRLDLITIIMGYYSRLYYETIVFEYCNRWCNLYERNNVKEIKDNILDRRYLLYLMNAAEGASLAKDFAKYNNLLSKIEVVIHEYNSVTNDNFIQSKLLGIKLLHSIDSASISTFNFDSIEAFLAKEKSYTSTYVKLYLYLQSYFLLCKNYKKFAAYMVNFEHQKLDNYILSESILRFYHILCFNYYYIKENYTEASRIAKNAIEDPKIKLEQFDILWYNSLIAVLNSGKVNESESLKKLLNDLSGVNVFENSFGPYAKIWLESIIRNTDVEIIIREQNNQLSSNL